MRWPRPVSAANRSVAAGGQAVARPFSLANRGTDMYKPLLSLLLSVLSLASSAQDLARYVDPRIGSVGVGRTFPGPSAPFGMVKPGPDAVSMPNAGWGPMPEKIKGFSQTHVSGTGGGQKYGNVLIQPIRACDVPSATGLLLPDGRIVQVPVYAQERQSEDISAGCYSCTYGNGVSTEVTTAARCAMYRFRNADALYIDAASFLGMDTIPDKRETQQYVGSVIGQAGGNEVCGHTTVRGGWNNGGPYTVYFCLRSDVPFGGMECGDSLYARLQLPAGGSRPVTVKVGISYVSVEQARRNISPLSFDGQRDSLRAEWSRLLRAVPYTVPEGSPPSEAGRACRMFYTALYHSLLMPVDKTGENPGGWGGPYYDDYYAIWDTYRTSFPLLMEYYPDRAVDMINALLGIYSHEGYMPDARSGDSNGRTQGGSNAEVVIAEAFARGLRGIDYRLALEAMIKDAETPPADDEKEGRGGLREYNEMGYIPYGIPRAGTRTVEYSYDDWCIAQVARGLGRDDLYGKYMRRSRNWQNLWRGDYEWQGMRGFIMPKDAQGRWLDSVPWGKSRVYHPAIPYKPDTKVAPWYIAWWDTFFYEALSAEYSLSIPHDIPTLIRLCGGDSAFRRRLDTFFDHGHYNVGNEPSFLTPYLYSCIGRADLASRRVSSIVNRHFSDAPNGLPGNDDGGAMSSWLVWAMLGRYPVAGQGRYIQIEPVRMAGGGHAATVSFVLNRQYRTWRLSATAKGDTMVVTCNGNTYLIPRHVADHATGFCWESPYKPGNTYTATGTFLFVSRDAMSSLREKGGFVYDGITWRLAGQAPQPGAAEQLFHVRADVDGTEMWIDGGRTAWVRKMRGNPLGIDWTIAD